MTLPVFRCSGCGRELDALGFLREVGVYWPTLDAAGRTCAACGHSDELRLSPGQIELGYLYAAGTAHFAGMEPHQVPGLLVKVGFLGLRVEYQGQRWSIPARR